jgi:hypothetical protein
MSPAVEKCIPDTSCSWVTGIIGGETLDFATKAEKRRGEGLRDTVGVSAILVAAIRSETRVIVFLSSSILKLASRP